jgi:hypothetical protein
MRHLVLLVGLLTTAAAASAASADRAVTSPGKVLALARSGYSVAWLSAPTPGHCGATVHLWNLATGGTYALGRHPDALCAEGPSTGSGITRIAVAGNRVFWLAYAGGNTRDWILYTATTTRRTERKLELEEVDVDAPPPIVLGVGSGALVPYAVGSTVKVVAADGRLLYRWRAPGRITALTAIAAEYGGHGPGQLAVFVRGGRCFLLSAGGGVQQLFAFPVGAVQEFALAPVGLIVQLAGGNIEIRRGSTLRHLAIPAQAHVLDFSNRLLLYRIGDQVRARQIATSCFAERRWPRSSTTASATPSPTGCTRSRGRALPAW